MDPNVPVNVELDIGVTANILAPPLALGTELTFKYTDISAVQL